MQKQKSTNIGYLLAFFLGGIGAHLFYYHKFVRGIIYLLFSWTYIPIILGWIDMFFIKRWNDEFNKDIQNQTNITSEYVSSSEKIKTESFEITKQEQKNNTPPNQEQNKKTFYNEKEIILPEYSNLKVSEDVLAHLDIKSFDYMQEYNTFNYNYDRSDFIKDSIKYANKKGVPAKEIPFQSYWPTFRHLNERQLKWYFYWREQVLKENYLEVDLSYIFIFVYELLNYSFNKNPAFNVSMLIRLLNNYKEMHPELPRYLNIWIADMLYELGETSLAENWDAAQAYNSVPKLYEILLEDEDLKSVSMNVWKEFILNQSETIFFQNNRQKIYNRFKKNIPMLVQGYKDEGINILEEWFEVKERRIVRDLFNRAVVNRVDRQIHVKMKFIEPTKKLYEILTNYFRLSENIVRLEQGEKRLLKVDETVLPKNIKELIFDSENRFVTVKSKSETIIGSSIPEPSIAQKNEKQVEKVEIDIKLDWEEINKKEKDLLELQKKIDTFEIHQHVESGSFDNNNSIKNKENITSIEKILIQNNEKTIKNPLNQSINNLFVEADDELNNLIDELTEIEKDFLCLFNDNTLDINEAKEFAKKEGKMLSLFVTEINEKAYEFIDDVLLEENEDYVEFIQDYDDLLDILRGIKVEN